MNASELMAVAAARMILADLDWQELVTMNLCMAMDSDPRTRQGYDKAKGLFTIISSDGIPRAHDLVKMATRREIAERTEGATP